MSAWVSWELFGLLILLLVAAMLNGAESAYFSLGRLRLRRLSESTKGPDRLAFHIDRPHDLLVTLLVGITLIDIGASALAAFVGEPVGGSSTGAAVPRSEYWRTVREICDRHEVLWVADEVLVGAGRTGTWSALEPYRATPDFQVLGKGLSGGYAPLAAVAAPRRILDVLAAGSAAVLHAQTFVHSPAICAAGTAAIRYLRQHDLLARCREMGQRLHEKLNALRGCPPVGDIRGRGLLAGIEFVADVESRAPFPRDKRFAERFAAAAERAGLMVWPSTGHADGVNGDLALLAPPFVITEPELDEIVARLRLALEAVT